MLLSAVHVLGFLSVQAEKHRADCAEENVGKLSKEGMPKQHSCWDPWIALEGAGRVEEPGRSAQL